MGIANRGGHENVRLAAALNKVTRDLLAIAHHVLRGGGLVIDIKRVDFCASCEQVLRDRNVAGKVKRGLAIAAWR